MRSRVLRAAASALGGLASVTLLSAAAWLLWLAALHFTNGGGS
jgi:hypothetical protein